jgi:molybdopterin-guanine dinucleotide biosynthesis adapter protein
MVIFQVVGYKKRGKTTLVSNLIRQFKKDGFKVASLKHHGHGGPPDSLPGTDSYKHGEAGAIMTGVVGGGNFQLSINQEEWPLQKMIEFYRLIEVDVLIIEGFKKASYDKVVLIKDEGDLPLIGEVDHVLAVASFHSLAENTINLPYFLINESEDLYKWLKETFFNK